MEVKSWTAGREPHEIAIMWNDFNEYAILLTQILLTTNIAVDGSTTSGFCQESGCTNMVYGLATAAKNLSNKSFICPGCVAKGERVKIHGKYYRPASAKIVRQLNKEVPDDENMNDFVRDVAVEMKKAGHRMDSRNFTKSTKPERF